jgi:hypothetical protein
MVLSAKLSTSIKVLLCDVCKQPASSSVPGDTVVNALIVCDSCCARVPEGVIKRFLESAAWPLAVEMKEKVNES